MRRPEPRRRDRRPPGLGQDRPHGGAIERRPQRRPPGSARDRVAVAGGVDLVRDAPPEPVRVARRAVVPGADGGLAQRPHEPAGLDLAGATGDRVLAAAGRAPIGEPLALEIGREAARGRAHPVGARPRIRRRRHVADARIGRDACEGAVGARKGPRIHVVDPEHPVGARVDRGEQQERQDRREHGQAERHEARAPRRGLASEGPQPESRQQRERRQQQHAFLAGREEGREGEAEGGRRDRPRAAGQPGAGGKPEHQQQQPRVERLAHQVGRDQVERGRVGRDQAEGERSDPTPPGEGGQHAGGDAPAREQHELGADLRREAEPGAAGEEEREDRPLRERQPVERPEPPAVQERVGLADEQEIVMRAAVEGDRHGGHQQQGCGGDREIGRGEGRGRSRTDEAPQAAFAMPRST